MSTQASYGIGGFVTTAPAAIDGSGPPPLNLKGKLGQQYFDRSANPPALYIFNGMSWVTSGNTLALVGTAGLVSLATNAQAVAGTANTPGVTAFVVQPSNLASVFASPPPIGSTSPNSGNFTSLNSNSIGASSGSFGSISTSSFSDGGNADISGDLNLNGGSSRINFTSGPQILFGSGDPNGSFSAPVGSFYMNSSGSGSNDRSFVNTDGGATWAGVNTTF